MKKSLVVLVVGLLVGSSAMAECHSFEAWLQDDVEEAVDSIVEEGDQKNESVMVLTTVTTFSSTTYGSAQSSGTSGCGKKRTAYTRQLQFVAVTIDNLSGQIAQGGGPHLQSLTTLLGCPASAYSNFATMTQQNYEQIFSSVETEPEGFLTRLKEKMRDSPSLAGSCVYI